MDQYWPYTKSPAEIGYPDKPVVMGEFFLQGNAVFQTVVTTRPSIRSSGRGGATDIPGAWAWQYNEKPGSTLIQSFKRRQRAASPDFDACRVNGSLVLGIGVVVCIGVALWLRKAPRTIPETRTHSDAPDGDRVRCSWSIAGRDRWTQHRNARYPRSFRPSARPRLRPKTHSSVPRPRTCSSCTWSSNGFTRATSPGAS